MTPVAQSTVDIHDSEQPAEEPVMSDSQGLPTPIAQHGIAYSRRDFIGSRQQTALVYSSLLFMLASMSLFIAMTWWLLNLGAIRPWTPETKQTEIMYYVGGYFTALILFISGLSCAVFGYGLLSAAGAAAKEVIPRSDYALLSALIVDEKEKAIDLYVILNSLSGATGFFTKIGITGLPLATIALSIIFTILGLIQGSGTKLFDLASLTLGAFLGSYVQRQVPAARSRPSAIDADIRPGT